MSTAIDRFAWEPGDITIKQASSPIPAAVKAFGNVLTLLPLTLDDIVVTKDTWRTIHGHPVCLDCGGSGGGKGGGARKRAKGTGGVGSAQSAPTTTPEHDQALIDKHIKGSGMEQHLAAMQQHLGAQSEGDKQDFRNKLTSQIAQHQTAADGARTAAKQFQLHDPRRAELNKLADEHEAKIEAYKALGRKAERAFGPGEGGKTSGETPRVMQLREKLANADTQAKKNYYRKLIREELAKGGGGGSPTNPEVEGHKRAIADIEKRLGQLDATKRELRDKASQPGGLSHEEKFTYDASTKEELKLRRTRQELQDKIKAAETKGPTPTKGPVTDTTARKTELEAKLAKATTAAQRAYYRMKLRELGGGTPKPEPKPAGNEARLQELHQKLAGAKTQAQRQYYRGQIRKLGGNPNDKGAGPKPEPAPPKPTPKTQKQIKASIEAERGRLRAEADKAALNPTMREGTPSGAEARAALLQGMKIAPGDNSQLLKHPDYVKAVDELNAALAKDPKGRTTAYNEALSKLQTTKATLRHQMESSAYVNKVTEVLGDRPPAKIKVNFVGDKVSVEQGARIDEGLGFIKKMVGPGTSLEGKTLTVRYHDGPGRAFYSANEGAMHVYHGDPPHVIAHEAGHWIEHQAHATFVRATNFLDRRTSGEEEVSLASLHPFSSFNPREMTKKDKFFNDYVGKSYIRTGMAGSGQRYATEVTSMGIEQMMRNPRHLANVDPEHFDMVWDSVVRANY